MDWLVTGFRPLDGESFSKLVNATEVEFEARMGFRPLDGESFSKHNRKEY